MDILQNKLIQSASGFSSDSRTAGEGIVFVALSGQKTDGHTFVQDVLKKGAAAAVVQKGFSSQNSGVDSSKIIEVDDTSSAHSQLAKYFRLRFKGKVIAVGGSSGKTTTKEFLATVLGEQYKLIKTLGSQNGLQGVPKTLERLTADVEVALIEIGIDEPHVMIKLAEIVAPDIAVLTSIGPEHLERLLDVDTVYREEKILFDVCVKRGGHCFMPEDDEWLKKYPRTSNTHVVPAVTPGYDIPILQPHARRNAALAIAVSSFLGMPAKSIAAGVSKLKLPEGRGGIREANSKLVVIGDHYNANPDSLKLGIEFAKNFANSRGLPLKLVLGDMLDLGEATAISHEQSFADVINAAPTEAIFIGDEWRKVLSKAAKDLKFKTHLFADANSAKEFVTKMQFAPAVVLVKASHGIGLEVIEPLILK